MITLAEARELSLQDHSFLPECTAPRQIVLPRYISIHNFTDCLNLKITKPIKLLSNKYETFYLFLVKCEYTEQGFLFLFYGVITLMSNNLQFSSLISFRNCFLRGEVRASFILTSIKLPQDQQGSKLKAKPNP